MSSIRAENKHRIAITLSWDTIGRILTCIRGKKVAARSFQGKRTRKKNRDMTVSDYLEALASKDVANVQMDVQALRWVERERAKAHDVRVRAIAQNKANRKDPKDKLKPGRVAGKYYPKYEAALAKRRERSQREKQKTAKAK